MICLRVFFLRFFAVAVALMSNGCKPFFEDGSVDNAEKLLFYVKQDYANDPKACFYPFDEIGYDRICFRDSANQNLKDMVKAADFDREYAYPLLDGGSSDIAAESPSEAFLVRVNYLNGQFVPGYLPTKYFEQGRSSNSQTDRRLNYTNGEVPKPTSSAKELSTNVFSDINEALYWRDEISEAKNLGFVAGFGQNDGAIVVQPRQFLIARDATALVNNEFRNKLIFDSKSFGTGNETVTRYKFMEILAEIATKKGMFSRIPDNSLVAFTDLSGNDSSNEQWTDINRLASLNPPVAHSINPSSTQFRGNEPITREAAIAALVFMYKNR